MFTTGELALLAFIKIPCAIDHLVNHLPRKRTLDSWRRAVKVAEDHFNATCTGISIERMDDVYRQHKRASALSIEKTSGLPYMRKKLSQYTEDQFEKVQNWKPKWTTPHEDLAETLKKSPFFFGGTVYKRVHTIRSVAIALRHDVCIERDPNAHVWLGMSTSNTNALRWLYPHDISTPADAIAWLHDHCVLVANELGISPDAKWLQSIKTMSRGDEACFR
jgi:hypothetical protein